MYFHQYVKADTGRGCRKVLHARIVQRRHDQQYAVRTDGSCLVDLVRVDDEILAQYRQAGCCPGLLQVQVRTLEKLLIGQYGEAHGARFGIGLGKSGRVEIRPDDALAGGGLLDLGDDRGPAVFNRCAHGVVKPPARTDIPNLPLQLFQGQRLFSCGHPFPLVFQYGRQDVSCIHCNYPREGTD